MSTAQQNKTSKASEEAMKDVDQHASGTHDAVPVAEQGSHARSEAAHLHGAKPHSKAEGELRALENKEESTRKDGRATETYRNACSRSLLK